jgi:hypothetical protein
MPSTAVASPSGEGFLWWGEFDYFFDTTVGRTPSGVNQFVPCAFPVPRVGTQVYLSLSGNTSHFMVLLYLLRK